MGRNELANKLPVCYSEGTLDGRGYHIPCRFHTQTEQAQEEWMLSYQSVHSRWCIGCVTPCVSAMTPLFSSACRLGQQVNAAGLLLWTCGIFCLTWVGHILEVTAEVTTFFFTWHVWHAMSMYLTFTGETAVTVLVSAALQSRTH